MKLSKSQRVSLFGMFGGKCAYCGINLPENRWHADHVEAIQRDWEYVKDERGHYVTKNGITQTRATGKLHAPENDTLSNLFPSCVKCNILKGCGNAEQFRSVLTYMAQSVPTISTYSHVRHLMRFGKLTIDQTPVVFWFEKYREIQQPDLVATPSGG